MVKPELSCNPRVPHTPGDPPRHIPAKRIPRAIKLWTPGIFLVLRRYADHSVQTIGQHVLPQQIEELSMVSPTGPRRSAPRCYSPLPKLKITKIEKEKAKKDPVRSTDDEEKELWLENPLKHLFDGSFRKSRIFFSFPILNLNSSIPLRKMVSVSLIHKLVITLSICLTNISTDRMVVDTRVCNSQFDTHILLLGPS